MANSLSSDHEDFSYEALTDERKLELVDQILTGNHTGGGIWEKVWNHFKRLPHPQSQLTYELLRNEQDTLVFKIFNTRLLNLKN